MVCASRNTVVFAFFFFVVFVVFFFFAPLYIATQVFLASTVITSTYCIWQRCLRKQFEKEDAILAKEHLEREKVEMHIAEWNLVEATKALSLQDRNRVEEDCGESEGQGVEQNKPHLVDDLELRDMEEATSGCAITSGAEEEKQEIDVSSIEEARVRDEFAITRICQRGEPDLFEAQAIERAKMMSLTELGGKSMHVEEEKQEIDVPNY